MELTRRIAIEEAERGKIEITQKGEAGVAAERVQGTDSIAIATDGNGEHW